MTLSSHNTSLAIQPSLSKYSHLSKMFNIRRVAIIGAGPSGLIAAKYLKAQGVFDSITIFEQQDEVGGVWYYSDEPSAIRPIPQNDAFFPPDPPLQDGTTEGGAPIFPSPMYTKLHTNIMGSLMKLQGQEFPEDALLFPTREDTQTYLVKYGEDIRSYVKFCYQVDKVLQQSQEGREVWLVKASSTKGGEPIEETYDAVIAANGHYAVPFVPDINGIGEFDKSYPSTIIHSKHYRSADSYKGKKVLVIGNGPSGLDLAAQISRVSKGKPLISVRHPTPPKKLEYIGAEEIAEIDEFLVEKRGVRLKDGRFEVDIDAVIVCTGFFYSYPFFSPDFQRDLISDGKMVHQIYQHIFHTQHPTIAFLALNMKAVPWPLAEAQVAVLMAVWTNQVKLPETAEMLEWYEKAFKERGAKIQIFNPGEDAVYINEMHDWAMKAAFLGKNPPWWTKKMFWERMVFNDAKLKFDEGGCKAKTLEELGFHYDPEADASPNSASPSTGTAITERRTKL